jgi:Zn-dependent peptidase ImmA (M78 family)
MDRKTARDIDSRVEQILKEMGISTPPLKIEDVIEHLRIHHSYYSLEDPSLLKEIFHRIRIGAQKATDIVKKVNLKGLWLPDSNQILVDLSVKEKKRKWVNAHEVSHKIIPTHSQFFQGDTAETLDPDYHEMLEVEANYGASSLIFMSQKFTTEALDVQPCFKTVQLLSKRYQNTLATTLRRFVEFSHNIPLLGIINVPYWKALPEGQFQRCRYFIPSPAFSDQFSSIEAVTVLEIIDGYTIPKVGGMVGVSIVELTDDNGVNQEFLAESFFNQYDVLTLFTYRNPTKVIF